VRRRSRRLAGPVVRFGERSAPLLRRRQRRASRRRRSAPPPLALPQTPPRQAPPPRPRVRLGAFAPSPRHKILLSRHWIDCAAALFTGTRHSPPRTTPVASAHQRRFVLSGSALSRLRPRPLPPPSQGHRRGSPSFGRRIAVSRPTLRAAALDASPRSLHRVVLATRRAPSARAKPSTGALNCRLRCHTISGDSLT